MSNEYLEIPSPVVVNISSQSRLLAIIPAGTSLIAMTMLEKIYLACNLDPNTQASTFECTPPQAIASGIPQGLSDVRIAVFGLSPKQIGALWTVSLYQWIKVGDYFWCFAERLEDIQADIEKKKNLWNCLKILKQD